MQPFAFNPDPDARAARRIAVAHQMVERALELAEAAHRRAMAQMEHEIAAAESGEAPVDGNAASRGGRSDPIVAAERAARTVRLSLALAARLDSDEPVRRGRVRSDAAAERAAEAGALERARRAAEHDELVEASLRENMVFEVVEATLKASGLDRDAVHERVVDVQEQIAEADNEWEYDYVSRPVGAVIAKICADLGLEPDWSLWAQEDWAIEEALTNAPASPYAVGGVARDRSGDDSEAAPPTEERVAEPAAAHGSSP